MRKIKKTHFLILLLNRFDGFLTPETFETIKNLPSQAVRYCLSAGPGELVGKDQKQIMDSGTAIEKGFLRTLHVLLLDLLIDLETIVRENQSSKFRCPSPFSQSVHPPFQIFLAPTKNAFHLTFPSVVPA